MEGTQVGKRIIGEQRYRMVLFAALGFLLNLLYAFYHGLFGIINLSFWLITMCVYYVILGTMRFSVVLCEYKNSSEVSIDTEFFVMKLSGILLTILSIVLTGAIYLSLSQNIVTKYDEIIMITIATYTFYRITMTVIHAIKQRKNPSPLLAVIRNIGYAEVAASVLTLQQSMLASFGGMSDSKAHMMNALTGAVVCLFILILGISIWIRGIKKKGLGDMTESKLVKANEKIAEKVVNTFEKIVNTVVGEYTKIEDAFLDRYLTKDGETVAEAKQRLKEETKSRKDL